MKNQQGMTLIGIVMICIGIIIVAIGGLKIAPAYIEYFTAKKAIVAIALTDGRGTVGDIRAAFDRRAAIDDITVITPKDLEITKEGNDVVISFSYPKKIPLFGNVSALIDFSASSNN
jgi:Tfp pilus assembly major pilin PilA